MKRLGLYLRVTSTRRGLLTSIGADGYARQFVATRMFTAAEVPAAVESALASAPIVDIHTHLFPPSMGGLALSGIDDLLTYHYLEAEFFRASTVDPCDYWRLSKPARADLI